jgi:hypothetical protein
MRQPKNEAIGEVECPQKGCTKKAKVYRFRQRTAGRSQFAGKLYCDCEAHGRYGADGKQAAQEYILENATIWGSEKSGPENPAQVPALPAQAAAKPAAPSPTLPAPTRVTSISSEDSGPAPTPDPSPSPAASNPWKTLLG